MLPSQMNHALKHIQRILLVALLAGMASGSAWAQRVAVSTNVAQWAALGTINAEMDISVSQHLSIFGGGRVNPWTFEHPESVTYLHQNTVFAGVKYWPWHVYSGWWVAAKAQYSNFEETGLWRPALQDATAIGAGLSFGYNLMLSEHFNVDFGLGAWAGSYSDYTLYCCPNCMDIRDSGPRSFVKPDDLRISLMYVF